MACGIPKGGAVRAHIVPRACGGPDTVENLHILCDWCHHNSEFLEGDTYWRWLGRQNLFMSLPATFARFGMSLAKVLSLSSHCAQVVEPLLELSKRGAMNRHEFLDRLEDLGIDIRL
jgi:hypothetical protein